MTVLTTMTHNNSAIELQNLDPNIISMLLFARSSTGLDASCNATVDDNSLKCKDERTKSNSKSTKGRKGKGIERSKRSKGDKLEFDVAQIVPDPCLLAESNSISTIVKFMIMEKEDHSSISNSGNHNIDNNNNNNNNNDNNNNKDNNKINNKCIVSVTEGHTVIIL